MEKDIHANEREKKPGKAILILHKVDFGKKKPILITQGKYPSRQRHTGLQKRHTKDQKIICH